MHFGPFWCFACRGNSVIVRRRVPANSIGESLNPFPSLFDSLRHSGSATSGNILAQILEEQSGMYTQTSLESKSTDPESDVSNRSPHIEEIKMRTRARARVMVLLSSLLTWTHQQLSPKCRKIKAQVSPTYTLCMTVSCESCIWGKHIVN